MLGVSSVLSVYHPCHTVCMERQALYFTSGCFRSSPSARRIVEMCPGECTLDLKVYSGIWNKIRDDLQRVVKFDPLAS